MSEPAFKIVNSFITGVPCDIKPLPKGDVVSIPNALDETFNCEACNRVFIGNRQWKIHLSSNKHKKVISRKNKLKEQAVS